MSHNNNTGDSWTIQDGVNCVPFSYDGTAINSITTGTWWPQCYCTKSAREKVQDEILAKMADAVSQGDLKKAGELVKLAKALKEL